MTKKFTHLGNLREIDAPQLSDVEMAGKVRMLTRSDMDHEAVVCAARDRILHLSQMQDRLVKVLGDVVGNAPNGRAGDEAESLLKEIKDNEAQRLKMRLDWPYADIGQII